MGITHLLNRSITIERWSGTYDDYGNPVYSAAEVIPARIFKKNKITRNIEGKEVVSTTQIYIESTATTKDRITLPTGEQPLVINVESQDDYTTFHHSVIHT